MNNYEKTARLMAPHVPDKVKDVEFDNEQAKLILAYEMLGYCKLPVSKIQGASGSQKKLNLERKANKLW